MQSCEKKEQTAKTEVKNWRDHGAYAVKCCSGQVLYHCILRPSASLSLCITVCWVCFFRGDVNHKWCLLCK